MITLSCSSPLYRRPEITQRDSESLDVTVLKKKNKKRKRDALQTEVEEAQENSAADEPLSQTNHVVLEKTSKPNTGINGSFLYIGIQLS